MERKNGNKFLVLDGHSLVYRAFFALPLDLQTKKGLHTNAVLGFTNMLLRLIGDQTPAYILTTFDYPAPTFRHRVFQAYKATREKTPHELQEQLPLIKEILQAFNIAIWEMEGYEADDLLGAFARLGEKAGLATYIVTADADAYQLLSAQVKILITRRGITRLEEFTVEKFWEDYGLAPHQWVDFKALKGDTSDNIPGVPGIGEKRALQLLKEYHSLEQVLAHARQVPGKMGENLSAYSAQALMSKELATICVDVPLDLSLRDCRLIEPNWDNLLQIFNRLELRGLAKKIPELAHRYKKITNIAAAVPGPCPTANAPSNFASIPVPATDPAPAAAAKPVQFTLEGGKEEGAFKPEGRRFQIPCVSRATDVDNVLQDSIIIKSAGDLQRLTELCQKMAPSSPFALLLDTVPARLHQATSSVKGLALALTEKNIFYISLTGGDEEKKGSGNGEETRGEGLFKGNFAEVPKVDGSKQNSVEDNGEIFAGTITFSAALRALQALLERPEGMLITHDLKPLLKHLTTNGIHPVCPAFDTLLAAYLLQPERPAYHLPSFCEEYLSLSLPAADKGLPAEEASRKRIQLLTLCARHLFALKEAFLESMESRQLKDLFFQLEMPLVPVLAKMELRGIKIEAGVWEKLAAEMEKGLARLEKEIMTQAGEEFNLNSPQQLSYILFEKLGLPIIRRTKTGYSTDARVLQELSALHPLVAQIMEYRTLAKLKNTYLQGMHSLIHPRTGKIHTTFNQAVTATGRLSSKDPNLQNIPIRLAEGRRLRQAFIPADPGNLLLSADYSQIELRVMAHLSQDPGLVTAFQNDEDIHRRTAAEVFNVSPAEVTPLMRERAKAVNFGIIYGISDYGLAQGLQISRAEARRYIESYFDRYPGVKKYAGECIHLAREKGYVTTLLKRRRYLPEINHPSFSRRSVAERAARNTPIQGSAADLIKAAMLAIDEELESKKLTAAMLLQVHDELIFELPPAELPGVTGAVKKLMENIFPLLVPLKVELKTGPDWYHLAPFAGNLTLST